MKKIKTSFINSNIIFFISSLLIIVLFLKLDSDESGNHDKFDRLNTFFKVLRLVDDKYVEDPDLSDLTEGAISGMLNSLDPHSIYINKQD